MTITLTERRARIRFIKAGAWDDCILYFADGSHQYVASSELNEAGELQCSIGVDPRYRETRTYDIADVVRVVR